MGPISMNLPRIPSCLWGLAIVGMLVLPSCKGSIETRVDCEGLFNEVLNSRLQSEFGDVTGEAIKADRKLVQASSECKPTLEQFVRNGTTDQKILAIDYFMSSEVPDASDILIDVLGKLGSSSEEEAVVFAICTAFTVREVKNKEDAAVQLRKHFKSGETYRNMFLFKTLAKLSPLQAMAFTMQVSESKNLKEVQKIWPIKSFVKILEGTGNKECVEYAKGLAAKLRAIP